MFAFMLSASSRTDARCSVPALQILFMISWIHRDVSSGNILYFDGHGKLGDLEYAKPFDLDVGRRSSDPKTVRVSVTWHD